MGADGGIVGWIISVFTFFGILFILQVVLIIVLLTSPKTPNKGTLIAFFGGPLVYIYVGKWGKAIGLYILMYITGGIAFLFLWPYSMMNIRTDVRTYLEDIGMRQTSRQKTELEVQKLTWEVNTPPVNRPPIPDPPRPTPVASPEASVSPKTSEYSLTLKVTGEGSLIPPEGTHRFKEGTVVFINANPSEGMQFAGWIGQVEDPYSSGTSIEINSDKTITATFQTLE
ncbi:hypothetical protein ACFLXX_05990 [Chloroflexota bacterium]